MKLFVAWLALKMDCWVLLFCTTCFHALWRMLARQTWKCICHMRISLHLRALEHTTSCGCVFRTLPMLEWAYAQYYKMWEMKVMKMHIICANNLAVYNVQSRELRDTMWVPLTSLARIAFCTVVMQSPFLMLTIDELWVLYMRMQQNRDISKTKRWPVEGPPHRPRTMECMRLVYQTSPTLRCWVAWEYLSMGNSFDQNLWVDRVRIHVVHMQSEEIGYWMIEWW